MYAPAGGGEHQISRAPFIDFAVDRTPSTPSEIIVDRGGGMTMRSVDYAWRTNRNGRREIRRRAIGSSTRRIIEHIHPPADVVLAQPGQLVALLLHQLPRPVEHLRLDHRRIDVSLIRHQKRTVPGELKGAEGTRIVV